MYEYLKEGEVIVTDDGTVVEKTSKGTIVHNKYRYNTQEVKICRIPKLEKDEVVFLILEANDKIPSPSDMSILQSQLKEILASEQGIIVSPYNIKVQIVKREDIDKVQIMTE